jgi:hypothetical protein
LARSCCSCRRRGFSWRDRCASLEWSPRFWMFSQSDIDSEHFVTYFSG